MLPDGAVIYGHPASDPDCDLYCFEILPDPVQFPGKRPGIAYFPPGVWKNANPQLCAQAAQFMALHGYIGFLCTYRAQNTNIDGQNPGTGFYPNCFEDSMVMLARMRADSRIQSGRCGIMGGSAGGSIAAYGCGCNLPGLGVQSDRYDFGVALSGCYLLGDNTPEDYLILDGVDPVERTLELNASFCQTTTSDLSGMNAKSVATNLQGIISPLAFFDSEHDTMPHHQLQDLIDALTSYGSTNAPHWMHDTWLGSGEHAFHNFQFFQDAILAFCEDPTAIDAGGNPPPPPPPPPEQEPTGYYIWTEDVVPDDTVVTFPNATGTDARGRSIISVHDSTTIMQVSQASSGTTKIAPFNAFGEGPTSSDDWQTLSDATLKDQPRGTFWLPSAPGGNLGGDLSNAPQWAYAEISGARCRGSIGNFQPNSTDFVTDDLDTLLAVANDKGKGIGLSVAFGTAVPNWWYTEGGATPFTLTGGPESGRVPLIWQAAYLALHRDFALRSGALWDSSPEIFYHVLGGFGQIVEMVYCKAGDFDALTALAQADGFADLAAAWTFACQAMLQNWMDGWPTTPLICSLSTPFPGGSVPLRAFCAWGQEMFGERVGFMQAGLNVNTSPATVLWEIIHDASPTNPAGFQFVSPSSNEDRMDPGNTIEPYVALTGFRTALGLEDPDHGALSCLAKYVEVYPTDGNRPTGYQTAIEEFNTAASLLP